MRKILQFSRLILFSFIIISCSQDSGKTDRVVIAIDADITTLNPLYAFNYTEGLISEQIYLGLAHHKWDEESGRLKTYPMLAERWEWNEDSTSLNVFLREDVLWHDSVKFTAADFVFTYDLYSDPAANSKFFGSFGNYILEPDQSIDLEKSFNIISDYELRINFAEDSKPNYFDIDFPILPKHIFEKVKREELAAADLDIVGTGAYKLKSWNRNDAIILDPFVGSFLYNDEIIDEIIFKIINDYNSRLIQLENGEIDMLQNVRVESIPQLMGNTDIEIDAVEGRNFDYIGWNNIDPASFIDEGKIEPHNLFGDNRVRKALTHAINREQIVDEFLADYGTIASGPIAPLFKEYIEEEIDPLEYDREKAQALLSEAGWVDSNNNGILDKEGTEFKFTLNYVSGNPLREFAANLVKNDLSQIGIEAELGVVEGSIFFDRMFEKRLDAWIAGWVVPIPVNLKPYWHSNLGESFPNVVSFRNSEADILLERLDENPPVNERIKLYSRFQNILSEEQPVTFLYWKDDIVAFNKRLTDISITPLGAIHHCWEWRVSE